MAFPHVICILRHSSRLLLSVLFLSYTGGNCLVAVTSVGDYAVLPCDVGNTIDPHMDLTDTAILWSRTDLPSSQYVYFQKNGKAVPDDQQSSYVGRTSLFPDEVEKGNMALKLSRVQPSDEAIYICQIPEINKKSTVQLTVEPRLVGADKGKDVTLPCQTIATVPVPEATVEWTRADLAPPNVHVIRNNLEESALQNSVYRDRTSVSIDGVKDGDVSLTISSVQLSDRGVYTCYISSEKECVVQLIVGSPEVYVYAQKCNPSTVILHCLATGFLPKDVTLDMMRDGRVVDQLDGLQSTGVRPNGDGTLQIKKHVEILRRDPAKFSCELKHRESNLVKVQDWDRSELDEEHGPNILAIEYGVLSGFLLVLLVVLLLMGVWVVAVINFLKNRKERSNQASASHLKTNENRAIDDMGLPLQQVALRRQDVKSLNHLHRKGSFMKSVPCTGYWRNI